MDRVTQYLCWWEVEVPGVTSQGASWPKHDGYQRKFGWLRGTSIKGPTTGAVRKFEHFYSFLFEINSFFFLEILLCIRHH